MENRTPDLVIANDALYQLSYDPSKPKFLSTILIQTSQAQTR